MTLTAIAICVLGCDAAIYIFFKQLYGEKRRRPQINGKRNHLESAEKPVQLDCV